MVERILDFLNDIKSGGEDFFIEAEAKPATMTTFINEYNNGNPIAAEIKQWHKEIAENTFFFYKDGNLYHSDNIFTILTEYALKYNIHHKEEIVYKSRKYKFDPPYRIKDINWFAAIINGDFYSAYKILENKHLVF